MDKLTIEGVSPRFDGEYECDIRGMIQFLTSDEALTGDEAYFIQEQSRVRGNELIDAFCAGDVKFLMALAVVVLARKGKQIDIDVLMQKKAGVCRFDFEPTPEEEEQAAHPTVEGEPSDTTSRNSGTSSDSPSDIQANGLSRIGVRV